MGETTYKSKPFIFRSRGLMARPATDRPPDQAFFQNMDGCYEREEEAISSRYGSTIITRDPAGSGTNNYPLPSKPVTLARMLGLGASPFRYAGLSDGSLWRRASNSQGPFTEIATGLSGQRFSTLVANTFGSSQPFLFVYDKSKLIKDNGTGTPQQTGIFPPTQPVIATQYAPQINIIDPFASTSGYTTSGLSAVGFGTAFAIAGNTGTPILNYEQYTDATGVFTEAPDGMIASSTLADSFYRLKFNTIPLNDTYDIVALNNAYIATDTFTFTEATWSLAASTTGTIGKTVALDLSKYQGDDLIVLVVRVDNPQNIQEIRVQFDINGSGYTSAYYYKSIIPVSYQGNLSEPTVNDPSSAMVQAVFDSAMGITDWSQQVGQDTAPYPSVPIGLQGTQPSQFGSGQGSWSVIYLPKGQFQAAGNAGQSGADWSKVTGWQVQITTNSNGSGEVRFNGLYIQGSPTSSGVGTLAGASSYGGVGYDFRYTYWNANTLTESNGCEEAYFSTTPTNPGATSTLIVLRQAVDLLMRYSPDPQVTHVRVYAKGGVFGDNWYYADQIPNITGTAQFHYKYVLPDSTLEQGNILSLTNNVPVTSTLPNPISTTITGTLTPAPANTNTPTLLTINVANGAAVFVPYMIAVIGTPQNLEQVYVVAGGTGTFTAYVQLPHAIGEPLYVFATPAQPVFLAAQAYNQTWMAGDPNNPHYLYYTPAYQPEYCPPQNYIAIGTPTDPITAVVNFRGILFVRTYSTFYQISPGSPPTYSSTGSKHGSPANFDWSLTESEVWYQCLPDEAEALTRDGWKFRSDLVVGDEILSYDLDSGTCSWVPIEKINVYDYAGGMIRWKGGRNGKKFDFLFTPEHKWVWRPEPRRKPYKTEFKAHPDKYPWCYDSCTCGNTKSRQALRCKRCKSVTKEKLRIADDTRDPGGIVQAAPLGWVGSSLLTPHEAAILGWLVTDGSITRRGKNTGRRSSRIYQVHHSKYVSEIRALVLDCMTSCQDRMVTTPKGDTIRELAFLISTDYTEALLTKAGYESKDSLPSIVCKLDARSASAMFDAMMHGDGSFKKGGYRVFTQKPGPVLEAFRLLSFMCGFPTTEHEPNDEGVSKVTVIDVPALDCKSLKKSEEPYEGKVWCPTTRLGTWVTRYRGKISITGNSWDGLRTFRGADGKYESLIIEWLYRDNNQTPVELVDLSKLNQVISAFKNNTATFVYIGQDEQPHRLRWSTSYKRWRNDDVAATAMLVEPDTNQLLLAVPYPGQSGWAIVYEDITKDYDDGGWNGGQLVEVPIAMELQLPYLDVGAINNQKSFNTLTIDANPNNQVITPQLLFDDNNGTVAPITLPSFTGSIREKFQFIINAGKGQQAYKVSPLITANVTVAPILYQMDIEAAVLPDQRTSYDSYLHKFGTDESKLVKQGYFDLTSTVPVLVQLFADGNTVPYYVFTLAANPNRYESPIRVRFPAIKLRLLRVVMTCDPSGMFQLWSPIQVDQKKVCVGKGYERSELTEAGPA